MKRTLIPLLVVLSILLAACGVFNEEVQPNQVGVVTDGGSITKCVGPGLQNDMGWFKDLSVYTVDPLSFQVSNASVATEDTQIVSVNVTIQARRRGQQPGTGPDCPTISLLFSQWGSLRDDANLVAAVSSVAAQAIKEGVVKYNLSELLVDRGGLSQGIEDALNAQPLAAVVEFINVAVTDVDPDPSYLAILQEKANYTAKIEAEARRQELIQQTYANEVFEQEQRALAEAARLLAEEATTKVEVEIASREGEKIAAQYEVYVVNQAAFQLEYVERLKEVYNDKTVIIVPENSPLNLFSGFNNGQPVIIPPTAVPNPTAVPTP